MSAAGNCPDRETLRAYHAGVVDDEQRTELDQHLRQCAACLETLRQIIAEPDLSSDSIGPLPPLLEGPLATTGALGLDATTDGSDARDYVLVIESLALDKSSDPKALGRMGKYDVLRVLGHGGMGVVLHGYDVELRRDVAIKTLNHVLTASPVAKRRFSREARAAAQINHPHVVTIHSVDQHRGMPFIVMELVRGPTLSDEIRRRGRLDPIRVIRISAQIAAGLAAAHAQGVIHRDIKPGNVMFESDLDRLKITDFGLARVSMDNADLTSRELAVGTPAYMAPEQVTGAEIDARTDLFSLGCVMYAMLVGHSPFQGRNSLEMIRRVEQCSPPDVRRADETIPEFLAEMVSRLLSKKPDDRFQSAAELADVLNRHLAVINQTKSDDQGRIPLQLVNKRFPSQARRAYRPALWASAAAACLLLLVVSRPLWRTPAPAQADSQGSSARLDDSPVAAAKRPSVTVSQQGSADFRSIAEAVAAVAPNGLVLVEDDALYVERLVLEVDGITVRSPRRATVQAPDSSDGIVHALEIRDCRGVRVEGLRVRGGPDGHALIVHGNVARLTCRDLILEQVERADRHATVQLSSRVASNDVADESAAVTLERCVIRSRRFPCVWLDHQTSATHILQTTFHAAETAIGLWDQCGPLRVSGCIFQGGVSGINSVVRDWSSMHRLELTNNSFDKTTYWLGLHTLPPESVELTIANNLLLDVQGMELAPDTLYALHQRNVFRNNLWQIPVGTAWNGETMGRVAKQVVPGELSLRRDPQHPDYLRPDPDSPLARAGAGAALPAYVGALVPGVAAEAKR